MPRPRTGELYTSRGKYFARVTVTTDGVQHRQRIALHTDVRAVARAKLARLLAGDAGAAGAESFEVAARRVLESSTIVTAAERLSRLERYVFPVLGSLLATKVRASHVRTTLDAAAAYGLSRTTVSHVRDDLRAVFDSLWRDDLIPENPVLKVHIPASAVIDRRPRVVLTDAEFARLIQWPDLPLVLLVMCLASRSLGGMRTSDLHAWDWLHIDVIGWTSAEVPRPKTKSATRLVIPDVLVPVLLAWWRRCGEPKHGPVFPRRGGPAKGQRHGKRSHVRELRRACWDAGVRRGETLETDPIQSDTSTSRRLDFHSFRRAYATGLARAGVNNQQAMALAGHSSAQTHARYVRLVEVLEAPAGALPAVQAGSWPKPPESK